MRTRTSSFISLTVTRASTVADDTGTPQWTHISRLDTFISWLSDVGSRSLTGSAKNTSFQKQESFFDQLSNLYAYFFFFFVSDLKDFYFNFWNLLADRAWFQVLEKSFLGPLAWVCSVGWFSSLCLKFRFQVHSSNEQFVILDLFMDFFCKNKVFGKETQ